MKTADAPALKMCAYPGCQKQACSRGKKKGGVRRFRWCQWHKKGNGKKERLHYSKQQGALTS